MTICEIIAAKKASESPPPPPAELYRNAAEETRRLHALLAREALRRPDQQPRLEIIPEGEAVASIVASLTDDEPGEAIISAALGVLHQLPATFTPDGERFYSLAAVESIAPHALAVIRAKVATVEQAEAAAVGRAVMQALPSVKSHRLISELNRMQCEAEAMTRPFTASNKSPTSAP